MRHAYMILAHNNLEVLKALLLGLDDVDNDIIIHIDIKSDIEPIQLLNICKNSKVFVFKEFSIQWGGYSQINVELFLLKKALNLGSHDYYHLLSGVDLPLKSIKEINTFYEKNNGKEFIMISSKEFANEQFIPRLKYRHYFIDKCGKKKNIWKILDKLLIIIQKIFHITNTYIKESTVYCGSQWFDITESLANDLVKNENEFKKIYKYSLCCDEFFIQTFVMNSDYQNSIYSIEDNNINSNMRYVDFSHSTNGSPRVLDGNDVSLFNSNFNFARKIDHIESSDFLRKYYEIILKGKE